MIKLHLFILCIIIIHDQLACTLLFITEPNSLESMYERGKIISGKSNPQTPPFTSANLTTTNLVATGLLNEKTTCPHCSSTGVGDSYKDVRGMDDFLQSLRFLNNPTNGRLFSQGGEGGDNDSDDDFELPRFTLH